MKRALGPVIAFALIVALKCPAQNLCVNGRCSPSVSTAPLLAPPPANTGQAIKWHPGQYAWVDPNIGQTAQLAAVDALATENSIQGVEFLVNWGTLEGATPGDYTAGFAWIDTILAHLAAAKTPKHLILGVLERKFGTPPAAGTPCSSAAKGLLPAYLGPTGCVIAAPNAAGALAVTAQFWTPAVMDRLIALSAAYALRYDNHPLFEMYAGNGETAVAAPSGSSYSAGAYNTQLMRWIDAASQQWTHTQLRMVINYDGTDAQTEALLAYSAKPGFIIGGPDPELPLPANLITRTIQGNQVFRGAVGNTDYRGRLPWVGEVQGLGIGTQYTQTPAQIWTYESQTMAAAYMIWYENTYLGGAAQMWSTGMLPYIRSLPPSSAACPAINTGRCAP